MALSERASEVVFIKIIMIEALGWKGLHGMRNERWDVGNSLLSFLYRG